jgi:RHS repeat-associated protein
MTFPLWLRNPIGLRTNSRNPSLLSRKGRGPRLMIEPLEERMMLANVYWNVDANGSWDVADNWSTGAVPGAADDVFLDRPAGNFTISHSAGNFAVNSIHASTDGLVVAAGTLTIAAASELGDFSFASIVLNGNLMTSGTVNWSSGRISSPIDASGTPINAFTNMGTLTLAGPGDWTVTAGLVNAGTIRHAGLGNLFVGFGGALTNQVGAVYDLQGDQSVVDAGSFINRGTLRKSGGTGTSSMSSNVFRNDGGVIDVQQGILALTPNSGSATGGTFTVATGAVLDLSSQGVQVYTGTYTGSGGGTVRLRLVGFNEYGFGLYVAGATFNFPDGMFQWMGGTLDGGAAGLNNTGSITLAGADIKALRGVLNNSGTVVHAGTGNLSSGIFNNLSGGLYDFQGNQSVAGQFNNTGTLRKSAGAGSSAFPTDAGFNNLAGTIDVRSGTLTVNGGNYLASSRSILALAAGTMLDMTGSSTVSGAFTAVGDGIVQVSGGLLTIGAAGTTFDFKPGMFHWTANGQSRIAGADLTNLGSITLAGAGVEQIANAFSNAGTILHAGLGDLFVGDGGTLTNQVGAVYDLQANQSVLDSGGTFINRGTLRKSGGTGTSSINAHVFRNEAGVIDVQDGILALNPFSNSASSTGGTFTVATDAVLDLSSQGNPVYTGTYTGSGGGAVRLRLVGFNEYGFGLNVAGATFNFPTGMFQWLGGTLDGGAAGFNNTGSITLAGADLKSLRGVLNNVGTIVHAGTGTLSFATPNTILNNLPGSIYDLQGDLNFSGNGSGYSTFKNAGTLRKSGGTSSGSTTFGVDFVNAGGTIDVQTGSFVMKGYSNPALVHTGGTFRVAQNAMLDIVGHFTFDTQTFTGTYTGSGQGIVRFNSGTVASGTGGAVFDFPPGMFQWVEGTIDGATAPLTNRGTMTLTPNLQERQDFGIYPFLVGALANAGTFISVGAAHLFFQGPAVTGTLTNLPGGVFEFQGDGGSVQTGIATQNNFINQGTLRKSGPGTATINTTVFSNTGTLAVDAGAVRIQSTTVTQVAGGTLTAGTWQVAAGSSIDLATVPAITTNNARVILDSPGSSFAKLDTLANNFGSLSLLNDRDFTTTGPLTNTGSLTVGAGSTLSVTGTYSQTAAGSLSVQLGGDPDSGQFGQLGSAGAATLDGTFNAALVGGFGPTVGQSFSVMSFPSHAGDFSTYTGLRLGRFPLFDANLTATNLILSALTSTADLAFDSFDTASFPTNALSGQNVTLTYHVKNLNDLPAMGDWIDSVYLSVDGVIDPGDALLARAEHRGGVAEMGSYSETVTAAMPPLATGAYRVIVLVDSRGLTADANRGNNRGVSNQAIAITVPLLVLGTPVTGSIAPAQDLYYRVLVAPGADVTLAADFAALPGAEVSVRYASLPDQTNRDDATPAGQLHSRLLLSNIQGGTYYVRLHGREDAAGGVDFTLSAAASSFEITRVSPLKGSNQFFSPSIITLQGARFTPQTQVQIRQAGGLTRAAQSVTFISANKLAAKVDLLNLPVGAYEVVADDAGRTAVAFDAFTVTDKDNGGTGAWISTVSFVKVGGPIYLKFGEYNTSDNPVPAPLIQIRATDVGDPGAEEITGSLTIDTLPGSLPGPYAQRWDPFKVYGTSKAPGTSTFSLSIVEFAQTTVDWDSQKAALRPATIPLDAWDAVWDNLRPQFGETLSDFYQFLTSTALKLKDASGEPVDKIDRLFSFEIQKANNLPAVPVPATAVDIAFPALGLPLVFGRSKGDTIAGRYQLGRLGRGWIDNFDISIHEDAEHLVTIFQGGGVCFFKLQPDGSYRGAVGEFGSLTKVNGAFQLREKTGGVTAFRADGLLDFLEDTNGNRITAGYTGGQLTSLTRSSGAALTLSYTGARLHQVTDPAGGVATYEYDASGEHLVRVTTTAGTTEYAYTADADGPRAHALKAITFLDGTHLFFDYDSHGRLVRQQADGGEGTVRFDYDVASYSMKDAQNNAVTFFYDDSFRIRRVVDALGGVSTIQYDASNRPVIVGANGGGKGKVGYDAQGNPTSVQNPLGETQAFTYGASHSELATWKDALGNKTQFDHDAKGNLTATTQADGSTQRYSYDAQGNVVGTVNRLGQNILFTYNSSGQVTRKDLPDGTSVAYTYNARGNLETVVDATGTTRLEYLDVNPDLLTKITYPTGRSLEYTYQKGQRTRIVDQSGFTVNYSYDAAGRLDVLRDGSNGVIVDYDYDPLGRLASETRGNFTVTLYAYDNAGQLLEITHRAADATIQSQVIYTYDNLGRRSSAKTDGSLTTYGYDGVGRLTSVELPTGRVISYSYDAEGNRITSKDNGATANYTVNDLNEYVAFGSTNQTFDAAGNLVASSNPGGSTSYRYDAEGRLVSQITPSGTWAYEYDALGNRIASTHDGVRTEYLVDPSGLGNVVGEYDGAGNLQAHYVHGLGLTSRVDAESAAAYYQFDAAGNTTQLTGTGGTVLSTYNYLPFGERLGATETVANPFEYVGRFGVMRDGSGIDYMRSRWYAPAQGRFTQSDPIGLAGGVNSYAYADNDPVTTVDPSGLHPLAAWALEIAAAEHAMVVRAFVGEVVYPTATAAVDALGVEGAAAAGYAVITPAPLAAPAAPAVLSFGEFAFGGAVGLVGLYSAYVLANAIAEAGFIAHTGQFPACTPYIPNELQACDNPGSDILESILEQRFIQRTKVTRYVPSGDPNDLFGPAGFGAEGFVVPQATLPYRIDFQNVPAAGAPAQEVVVTHVLDADLDLDTFQLEEFGFGDLTFSVPAGRQSYSTRLDLRSTRGIFVDVVAGLDRVTRTVTWRLQAIDPETLDLPISPFVGFLPPDKVAPEGEGFVGFSIRAKTDLPTGTRIDAQATIVFDTNAPIDTNVWTNTIDDGAPTSTVNPLPAVTNSTSFSVSWSGSDDADGTTGSGIASFDVFVSDNGAPFVTWLHDTTETSADYPGESDHTYRFYSVARDNVGHLQAAPETAQAETTVDNTIDNTPPVLANMPADQTIEATMPAGTVATFTLPTATDDLDPFPTVSCSRESGSTFALGTTTITCTATDDAGNSSSASFRIQVRDTTPPVLTVPANMTVQATGPTGAPASFSATASDIVDGALVPICSPASGTPFPFGVTTVTCSSTDSHSNTATGSFTVTVVNTLNAIDVQRGAKQRSYVRYLDLIFDQAGGIGALMADSRISLTRHELDGSGDNPVPLNGVLNTSGNRLLFDFGANGIGGNRNTNVGDGYYELALDLDGNGTFETKRNFYRLLGDVNGDHRVDSVDANVILAAYGRSGANLDEDVNGDGVVNALDRTLAIRASGRKLKDGLHLDG